LNGATTGEGSSFEQHPVMEDPQASLDQGEVHTPFFVLFQEHCQFFQQRRFDESTSRLDANTHPVHVVIYDKEIRARVATERSIVRFFFRFATYQNLRVAVHSKSNRMLESSDIRRNRLTGAKALGRSQQARSGRALGEQRAVRRGCQWLRLK
jgi:hypothetical protein